MKIIYAILLFIVGCSFHRNEEAIKYEALRLKVIELLCSDLGDDIKKISPDYIGYEVFYNNDNNDEDYKCFIHMKLPSWSMIFSVVELNSIQRYKTIMRQK